MSHKKIFLSIDFDFWNNHVDLFPKHLNYFIQYAKKRRIPITAVTNHQQMLRYVDKSDARILFNIDTHSDIVEKNVNFFDCGSWVSYVRWRREGTYVWMHAGDLLEGDCSAFRGGDFYGNDPKCIDYSETDWMQLQRIFVGDFLGENIKSLRLQNIMPHVCFMSFCVSPVYSYNELVLQGKQILRQYNIPILRGRLDEQTYGVEGRYPR